MDVNRVDIKVLLMHCWRLGGPEGLPAGPPTVKGPIQVWSMSPSLEGFKKKNQKAKITIRNQIWNDMGLLIVRQISQKKEWQKSWGPLCHLFAGDPHLMYMSG